ncbi:hypothetical protein [Parabacteroides gordonii]
MVAVEGEAAVKSIVK